MFAVAQDAPLATPPPQAPGLEMPAGRVWAAILSLSVLKLILLPVIASQLVATVGCSGAEGNAGAFADVAYFDFCTLVRTQSTRKAAGRI